MTPGAAAFLDRDGVLNELIPDPGTGRPESPLRAQDVRLIPGVGPALRRLAAAGLALVGVSNQPAAAKGTVSIGQLEATQNRVVELLAAEGVIFDDFRLCFHHPEGIVPALARDCECRKPAPGMLRAAARQLGLDLPASTMIGDTDADVRAGRAAGCQTVLIEHPGSAHKRAGSVEPDRRAPDLASAVAWILGQSE